MIFNKNDNAPQEIYQAIGLIDADVKFTVWKPQLILQTRKVMGMVSPEVYNKAVEYYYSESFNPDGYELWDRLVTKIQLSIALFAWVKLIPSLDAGHSASGRKKIIGENEKALTLAEAYKDEANILSLAYDSVDDILALLFIELPDCFKASKIYSALKQLLVPDLDTFDGYYRIDSYRLFVTLTPFLREIQEREILAILSQKWYDKLLAGIDTDFVDSDPRLKNLLPLIRRAMVLLAMCKGFERLPVELIPEGVMQTRIIGTTKEKLTADSKARKEVIEALRKDAESDLNMIRDLVAELEGAELGELYVAPPKAVDEIKGFLFN